MDAPTTLFRALISFLMLTIAAPVLAAPDSTGDHATTASVLGHIKLDTEAVYAAHRDRRPIAIQAVPLAEFGDVQIELEPFIVIDHNTVMLAASGNGPDRPIDFDPSSVATFKGEVIGLPGSSVYLAIAPHHGGTGVITLADGRSFRFSRNDSIAARANELVLDVFFSSPALGGIDQGTETEELCGTGDIDSALRGVDGDTPVDPSSPMLDLEMAIDCDFEFYSMFPNEQATLEHLAMLFGEISAIYQRDVRTRVRLVFVRIWQTEDDPYLPDNSTLLTIVSQELNDGFPAVRKDAVSLISGRKDLVFGGVAQLSQRCDPGGREWYGRMVSVNGFQTPVLPNPAGPHLYEFNVGLICHELGHNCGASHTHAYGFDDCDRGTPSRGTIMSYCHTVAGGNGNLELRFDSRVARFMRNFLETNPSCIPIETDADSIADADQILADPSLDTDQNGIPDAYEDRNNNGVPDGVDIDDGLEIDIDGNRVPDRFEPDCNGNSLPDHYEIAEGLVEDGTYNGVPDECEPDCNADGIADVNQFHETLSLDLDRNYQLDECQDCDGNGVQDFEQLGTSGWVYLATEDGIIAVNAAGIAVARGGPEYTTRVAVHPDGRVVTFDEVDREIVVLSPDLSVETGRFPLSNQDADDIVSMDFKGTDLYITANHFGIFVLDSLETGAGTILFDHQLPVQEGEIYSAELLKDGSGDVIAMYGDDFDIHRIDGETGLVEDTLATDLPLDGGTNFALSGYNQIFVLNPISRSFSEIYEIRDGGIYREIPSDFSRPSSWGLAEADRIKATPWGTIAVLSPGPVIYHEYDPGTLELLYRHSFYIYEQTTDLPGGPIELLANPQDAAFAPAAPGDCNRNGIPDSCDIAEGRAVDANGDGIPDSCNPTRCIADMNNDGTLTPADFTAWLIAYRAGDMLADSSLDGFVRFDDFSAWMVAYQGGCD